MREIVLGQLEVAAHLEGQLLEGLGETGLEGGASRGAIQAGGGQEGLAKCDPYGKPAAGTPETGEDVNAVAAHDDAGDDGSTGHLREAGNAGAQRGAFQYGGGAIADATLREDAEGTGGAEAGKGDADGVAVEMGAVHGEGIDGAQPWPEKRQAKEFHHAHPIDLAADGDANERGIEVADMV